jgi:hypothetical protein
MWSNGKFVENLVSKITSFTTANISDKVHPLLVCNNIQIYNSKAFKVCESFL